jgi:hypothetical protein
MPAERPQGGEVPSWQNFAPVCITGPRTVKACSIENDSQIVVRGQPIDIPER